MQLYVKNLNECYKNHPALYEKDFQWMALNGSIEDAENTCMSFIRKGHDQENDLIVVCNFSPAYEKIIFSAPRRMEEVFFQP